MRRTFRQPKSGIKPSKSSTKAAANPERRALYSVQPWTCVHHADRSEITAYVEASGKWETIATIPPTAGASAETLAAYIADVMNKHQQTEKFLHKALTTLQEFLDEGVTWSTESEAEHLLRQIGEGSASKAS